MAGGEARSVALETTYVHEVYEEISTGPSASSGTASAASGRAWPKVAQFLHDLEPGAIVCDVGCGNGKYLSINPAVFKIGVDRCLPLTELAREKEHEVLVCDNLALPFRDEAFDAVLSVAVVHHLATTERRVSAIRELTRVLRIGGRLIITVWAMEQRHRKFESQDVLVPWHRPQPQSTPSLELTSTTTTSEEDLHPPYHAYTQTSDSDSCRSASAGPARRRRHKGRQGRSIDTGRPVSSSASSSSLSSPNETCYSFVRRALQRLAGGKRSAPWFLDSWAPKDVAGSLRRHEPEGCEDCNDIQDLPIELRRLEEDQDPAPRAPPRAPARTSTGPQGPQAQSTPLHATGPLHGHQGPLGPDWLPLHLKSKSLSDILSTDPRAAHVHAHARALVRSRSSVPSLALGAPAAPKLCLASSLQVQSSSSSLSLSVKPRLVKQKQSMCEEEAEVEEEEAAGGDQPTDMRNLVRALPDFKRLHGLQGGHSHARSARLNVFKQSSMNEELMSAERLREKERVRRNIQKQASLNEELMFRHRPGAGAPGTLDSLRDTLFSASTAKRFQLLKIGLTSKLKSSTTNIEKVAGTSLKNGFARMLQGWKQAGEPPHAAPSPQATCTTPSGSLTPSTPPPDMAGPGGLKRPSSGSISGMEDARGRGAGDERRPSREDGSDSSKDSSLQSDTSVDSEDSFASVIFVPKADQFDPLRPKTPSPTLCTSAPPSPQPTSPKVLLYSASPSPPQLPSSPRLGPLMAGEPLPLGGAIACVPVMAVPMSPLGGPLAAPSRGALNTLAKQEHENRLQQIKEMLRQRNAAGSGRGGVFPLVRRASASLPRPVPPRAAPRLLSLELFNPETDDVDSDSSGVSSPDSVDSVISVANSSRATADDKVPAPAAVPAGVETEDLNLRSVSRTPSPAPERLLESRPETRMEPLPVAPLRVQTSTPASLGLLEAADDVATTLEDAVEAVVQANPTNSRARRRHVNLDAVDTRGTLEDHVARSSWSLQLSPDNSLTPPTRASGSPGGRQAVRGAVCTDYSSLGAIPKRAEPIPIVTKVHEPELPSEALTAIPEALSSGLHAVDPTARSADHSPSGGPGRSHGAVPPLVLSPREGQVADGSAGVASPPEEDCWDEDVRQHLADFAEQLSERLLEEIERYREDGAVRDLARLGEELQGLSKLSLELRDRPERAGAPGSFDKVLASLAKNVDSSSELLSRLTKNASLASLRSADSSEALTGVSSLSSSIRSTRSTDGDSAPPSELASEASDVEASVSVNVSAPTPLAPRPLSAAVAFADGDAVADPRPGMATPLRPGCSIESSDGGDFSERTTGTGSGTDSRRDTSSVSHGGKTASSASLASAMSDMYDAASDCSRDARFADRRTARCDGRSSSEEAPHQPGGPGGPGGPGLARGPALVRQRAALQEPAERVTKTESCTTSLSGSTSQDSLPSDNGGGAITYHRYYHVFREGELDQLIERYVENLHIISSYYDHTNWCVVAEKVQVWTI